MGIFRELNHIMVFDGRFDSFPPTRIHFPGGIQEVMWVFLTVKHLYISEACNYCSDEQQWRTRTTIL